MRGDQRLEQDRGGALVDRGGAHLHRRGRSDCVPDDDPVDAVERERAISVSARPGKVDAGRPGFPGRRSRDRAVHQFRVSRSRRSRARLRARSRSARRGAARDRFPSPSQDGVGCALALLGRHDREDDFGLADDRAQIGQELDRRGRSARCAVRSLRPSSVATTRRRLLASASASALPIAPRLTTPTVVMRQPRVTWRRDREPAAVAARPDIRVYRPRAGRTVRARRMWFVPWTIATSPSSRTFHVVSLRDPRS